MTQEVVQEPAAPQPGPIVSRLQRAFPGIQLQVVETPLDETVTVRRDDYSMIMEKLFHDQQFSFDLLRCVSGVDYLTELESVCHLYSLVHNHSLAVKTRCPYDDIHVPTVSHLWAAANWHERETHEMFGIVYDGHPDLRPLLTEEGLGYFLLRKSHPLAEIEEWQEDYLQAVEDAKRQMATATGAAPVVDEKAMKIQIAQQKAAIITKTREKARAEGLSPEDEKKAVQDALARFEEELASAPPTTGAAPPAMSKIEMAQAKAKVITKARSDARAQGMSTEDEKKYVAEKLKGFSAELEAGAGAPAPAPPKPAMSKIEMAQAKAKVITKARSDARAQGMSTEDEKKYVAEALKSFSAENS
ncbi:MAG: NADH-quinone oxidoreductase subunit C [Dehalococcoidia bacterium]